MLQITRYVGRVLACYPARRIEATVLAEFAAGCRWLERLGFEREDRNGLRGYDTTGRTFALYARIK
jgi:RimJ/RimL family protein N-acetyltransferase